MSNCLWQGWRTFEKHLSCLMSITFYTMNGILKRRWCSSTALTKYQNSNKLEIGCERMGPENGSHFAADKINCPPGPSDSWQNETYLHGYRLSTKSVNIIMILLGSHYPPLHPVFIVHVNNWRYPLPRPIGINNMAGDGIKIVAKIHSWPLTWSHTDHLWTYPD